MICNKFFIIFTGLIYRWYALICSIDDRLTNNIFGFLSESIGTTIRIDPRAGKILQSLLILISEYGTKINSSLRAKHHSLRLYSCPKSYTYQKMMDEHSGKKNFTLLSHINMKRSFYAPESTIM